MAGGVPALRRGGGRQDFGPGATGPWKAGELPPLHRRFEACLLNTLTRRLQEEIRKEAQTMSLLNHPNLVSCYCSFVSGAVRRA